MIFSKPDKKLYLLRNGITIGECPVKTSLFSKHVRGTSAFVFSGWKIDAKEKVSNSSWTQVSGQSAHHTETLDEWFRLDPRFQYLLQGIITPGTNLVVTSDPVKKRTANDFPLLQGKLEEAESK